MGCLGYDFAFETDGKGTCYDRLADAMGANDEQRNFHACKMHRVCRGQRSEHGAWHPYIAPVKDGVIVLAPQIREFSQPECQRPSASGICL
jgi:hypothetical protein